MTKTSSIDFEIIKEPWNKYQISDNSILKTRTILKKIERITDGEKISYNIDAQTLTVIYADPSLKGPPNPKKITNEELMKSMDKQDMRYDTLSQEFNEYHLDDGSRLKVFTNVTGISRFTIKDVKGDPVYSVNSSNTIEMKRSNQFK